MKKIYFSGVLGSGKFTLVDDEDYKELNNHKWFLSRNGYACCNMWINGKRKSVLMNRMIMGNPIDKYVDHKDTDKLNNQRSNLRICNNSQNQANRKIQKNNPSGYKGVTRKTKKMWAATIRKDNKNYHLGYFPEKIDAAKAYNEAAIKYFGEFARLNEIPE